MRLIEGIHLVGGGDAGFGLSHRSDGHIYAIASGGDVALIDVGTGLDIDSVVRHLRDDGLDPAAISRLFVTHYHPDHAGGLAAWRRITGAEVFAGRDGAAAIAAGDEETCGLAAGRRAQLYPRDWRLPGHLTISLSNGHRHVDAAVEHFRKLRLPPPLVP